MKKIITRIFIFLFVVYLIFNYLPDGFTYVLNNYWYTLPSSNSYSIDGKKVLLNKDGELVENIYANNSVEQIQIANIGTTTDVSTAILDDGTVVWSQTTANKFIINKFKDGNTSVVKEYSLFDLDKFARDYKAHLVSLTPAIQQQVGQIWTGQFIVSTTSSNTISFLDAMVSQVDASKPTEVIVRQRSIDVNSGIETVAERERESLSLKDLDLVIRHLEGNDKFEWFLFKDPNGKYDFFSKWNKFYSNVAYPKSGYGFQINREKSVVKDRKYKVGDYEGCPGGLFSYGTTCEQWFVDSLDLVTVNSSGTSTQRIFTYGRYEPFAYQERDTMNLIGISDKKQTAVVEIQEKSYAFDLRTFKSSLLSDSGDVLYLKD